MTEFTKDEILKNLIDNKTPSTKHDGFAGLLTTGIFCQNPTSIERFPGVLDKIEEKKKTMTIDSSYNLYVAGLNNCFGLFKTDISDTDEKMSDEKMTVVSPVGIRDALSALSKQCIIDVDPDKGENNLLKNYSSYLSSIGDDNTVIEQFRATMSEMCPDNSLSIPTISIPITAEQETILSYMTIMNFCWAHADKIMNSKKTGGMLKDDETSLTISESGEKGKYYSKRVMIALSLFAQIFYLFLLFENFRLLFTTIESIIDAGADFNNNTGHGVLGFFEAGHQILLGNMVNTLTDMQGSAVTNPFPPPN